MIDLQAFNGVRPLPEAAAAMAAPPPQGLAETAVVQEVQTNPLSFLRVTRSDALGDNDQYQLARKNLDAFLQQGLLQQDASPCLYLYHHHTDEEAQIALIGLLPVTTVLELEEADETLAAKRATHILATEAHTSLPVLTYAATRQSEMLLGAIAASRTAAYDFFTSDGHNHTLYVIDDADDIEALRSILAGSTLQAAAGAHLIAAARQAAQAPHSPPTSAFFPALLTALPPHLKKPEVFGFRDALVLHLL
nr:DUF1015 family protein [uncultured Anaeromusa sp.]